MATIKYLLQSKSKTSSVYIRLSAGRKKVFYKKTGLVIDSKQWSDKTGFAKPTTAQNKNTNTKLRNLHNFILEALNDIHGDTQPLNSKWLGITIDSFFQRNTKQENEEENKNLFVNYGLIFISRLDYRVTKNGKKGVAKPTKTKYKTIVNKVAAYEKHHKEKVYLTDVDLTFREKFISYLRDRENINDNTIGRYLSFVKSICLDAIKYKYKTSPELIHFKGFTIEVEHPYLNFEEIKRIQKADITEEKQVVARDWLIIGCYTGQRVSDLLRMEKTFIETIQGYSFIELTQTKTNKIVQIPIHTEVLKILNKYSGNFPPRFTSNQESSKTMFNRYLKRVCRIAGINDIIQGSLFNKEAKKQVKGFYEKYKLVSSHICRRSFATNFYGNPKFPTPLLMNITAHSTEKQFLAYVKKKPIDRSLQLAKAFESEAKEAATKNLVVIRNAVNN